MSSRKIRVAVVGLGFGRWFVDLYRHHPSVEYVGICDADTQRLAATGDSLGITHRSTSLDDVLASRDYDAVHLLTPVDRHAAHAIAALNAGKHCAVAVPMATTLDDLRNVLAAQRRTGLNYMMMETQTFRREYLLAKDLHARGEIGNIQFMRGAHCQDIEGFPAPRKAIPPMLYMTHAIAPLLDLPRTRATRVFCLGSGKMREELAGECGYKHPLAAALFALEGTPTAAEVLRSHFETAIHDCLESFEIFGDKASFHMGQFAGDPCALVTIAASQHGKSRATAVQRPLEAPYRPDLLPPEMAKFANGMHGGAHPHLVHAFVSSIVEERAPKVDAVTAANWTAAGICAHASLQADGEVVAVPKF